PRRGAGDDGARRQGTGSADRRSRRYHDATGGAPAAPAAGVGAGGGPLPLAPLPPRGPRGGGRPPPRGRGARAPGARRRGRERAGQEAEDEYRRLLYVAMTRAIDRLVICGADGERARPEGCWWNLVFDALKPPVSLEEPADDGDGRVWRYCKTPPSAGKSF